MHAGIKWVPVIRLLGRHLKRYAGLKFITHFLSNLPPGIPFPMILSVLHAPITSSSTRARIRVVFLLRPFPTDSLVWKTYCGFSEKLCIRGVSAGHSESTHLCNTFRKGRKIFFIQDGPVGNGPRRNATLIRARVLKLVIHAWRTESLIVKWKS